MRFATGPLTRHGHAGDTVIEQVLRIYLTIATETEIATEFATESGTRIEFATES